MENIPFYRYSGYTRFSFELLKSYIDNVEAQVKTSIEGYEQKKETIIQEDDPEGIHAQIIDIHNGLDSQTWDLDAIFKEHFPNIQRKSALLSLYSFFEHELIQLCKLFKETENFKLGIDDISGKGIISNAIKYLGEVACIKVNDWNKIHDIRKIRNLIVHHEGRLDNKTEEKNIIKQTGLLRGDNEVIIIEGYLQYVLEIFEKQFQALDLEIKRKYPKN